MSLYPAHCVISSVASAQRNVTVDQGHAAATDRVIVSHGTRGPAPHSRIFNTATRSS
jgi:hypothetical protein